MHKAASAGVATPPAAKFTTWAGDRSKHTSYRLVTVQRGVCWQLSCLLDLQERQRRVFLRRRDAGETMTMTWPAARGRWERQSPASQRTDGCNLVHVEGYDHEPEGLPHISYLNVCSRSTRQLYLRISVNRTLEDVAKLDVASHDPAVDKKSATSLCPPLEFCSPSRRKGSCST